MKKRRDKALFCLVVIRDIFFFGAVPGLLVAGAIHRLFRVPIEDIGGLCIAVGSVIAGVVLFLRAKKKIEMSNERMKDAAYLESLESLGFIRLRKKQRVHGRN